MQDLFKRRWGDERYQIGRIERERRANFIADAKGQPRIRTRVEIEIMRRARLAVWAYAYEYKQRSLVSDHYFDAQCLMVDPTIDTGKPHLDEFFRAVFDPCTGSWIGQHPELRRVAFYYDFYFKKVKEGSDEVLPNGLPSPYWAQKRVAEYGDV